MRDKVNDRFNKHCSLICSVTYMYEEKCCKQTQQAYCEPYALYQPSFKLWATRWARFKTTRSQNTGRTVQRKEIVMGRCSRRITCTVVWTVVHCRIPHNRLPKTLQMPGMAESHYDSHGDGLANYGVGQSINQSVSQSINQIDQINQSINQSVMYFLYFTGAFCAFATVLVLFSSMSFQSSCKAAIFSIYAYCSLL